MKMKVNYLIFCVIIAGLMSTGCSSLKKLNVMVQMEPDQEYYFKNTIIRDFEKKTSVKVSVSSYCGRDTLENILKKSNGKINLIRVPMVEGRQLMAKGYCKPFDSFLSSDQLHSFNGSYILTSVGTIDGRPSMLPVNFETQVLVYCKSKVKDALQRWPKYKDQIAAEFKRYNGFGLPSNYKLEADPNKWDYYDIAVVGWIWSRTDYDGTRMPRIAHRGKLTYETAHRIIDRIFQLNGDSVNVLNCKGDAVVDAIYWEAFYAASGVYNKKMWENSWGEQDVYAGFSSGELFMGYLSQSDCFVLHGTGHDKHKGCLRDPSDMGVAVMPSGCSFELDTNGNSVRIGQRSVTTGSWWWAIPYNASNAMLSYKLASYVTDTVAQVQECSRFGMIPVRKEVIKNIGVLFKEPWMKETFDAAFRQVVFNGPTVIPYNVNYDKIASLYIDLWYDIVVGRNWSVKSGSLPDRKYIKNLIETKYAPKALKILSGEK